MTFSIVIPSKVLANLQPCIAAIRAAGETARIIVVDNGLAGRPPGCEYVDYPGDFVFSHACNMGILSAGADGVCLCNDDALLKTPGGFTLLAKAAEEHPDYGVISAVMRNVGNPNQFPHRTGLVRSEPRMVTFTAVYLPRATFEKVGLLDERFGGVDRQGRVNYAHEDDDFCLRIRRAGLKIGIHDGCLVDHSSLKSTFRAKGPCPLEPGRQVFIQKWGSYPL